MTATELEPGSDAPEDGVRMLLEETSQLFERLRTSHHRVAAALQMAVEAFEEALLRLGGEALAGVSDDAQQDPLVLGVEPGVGTDE
jgi:hypothetical protein